MPNWCNNVVTISHKDPAKMAALTEAINAGNFCKFVIPIPEALTNTTAPNRENPEVLIEKTGYSDWYDFCVNEWGTKWDIDPYDKVVIEDGVMVSFGFDSAWAPPVGVYDKLYEEGYVVEASYYEPGMAFVGKYEHGFDECIDISGETSKTVVDVIGEELDDQFGISESMECFEDEENE